MDPTNPSSAAPASNPAPTVGSGSVSYDDLLSMGAEIEGAEKTPAEEKAGEEPKKSDAGPAAGEKKAEPEKKAEEQKKGERPTSFEMTTPDGKKLTVPADAQITFKVDGKEITVTASDAFRDRQIDTRFHTKMEKANAAQKKADDALAAANQKQQEIEQHALHIAKHLGTMRHAMQNGDVRTFITEYATMNGLSAKEVNAVLRESYLKQAKEWTEADEKGRKVLDLEDEREYSEIERERARATQQANQRIQLADRFAAEAAQENGISREEFLQARTKIIKERLNGRPLDIASASQQQVEQFVEAIVFQAMQNRVSSGVGGLISEIAPDLAEENPEEYARIVDVVQPFWGKYDHDELRGVVKTALGAASDDDAEEEEEATPIKSKQPEKARTSPATSNTNEDEEFADLKREVEDDPLAVYR